MNTQDRIKHIISAKKIEDILDISNFKDEYKEIISEIHPDRCTDSGASEATAKLNSLREQFENGSRFIDDAGDLYTNGYFCDFHGDEKLLKRSLDNYNSLRKLRDTTSLHFQKYLPLHFEFKDGVLHTEFEKRAISLSGLLLEQNHVNWILSRLLEFAAWLEEVGYVHCGLNPESVFIIPENHGLQVCSFYHLTKSDNRVKTISGRYKNWYPANLFRDKIADSQVDLELATKIAIYLLGDKSGSGVRLRKTHHEKFMDFVIASHTNAHATFQQYREFLKSNFEKKFYELSI